MGRWGRGWLLCAPERRCGGRRGVGHVRTCPRHVLPSPWQALRREESCGARFSIGNEGVRVCGLGPAARAERWSDEFLWLLRGASWEPSGNLLLQVERRVLKAGRARGGEARDGRRSCDGGDCCFLVRTSRQGGWLLTTRPGGAVQVEWLLEFAEQLRGESGPGGDPSGLLSSFRVVPLPTPAARAEASAAPPPAQNSRVLASLFTADQATLFFSRRARWAPPRS